MWLAGPALWSARPPLCAVVPMLVALPEKQNVLLYSQSRTSFTPMHNTLSYYPPDNPQQYTTLLYYQPHLPFCAVIPTPATSPENTTPCYFTYLMSPKTQHSCYYPPCPSQSTRSLLPNQKHTTVLYHLSHPTICAAVPIEIPPQNTTSSCNTLL